MDFSPAAMIWEHAVLPAVFLVSLLVKLLRLQVKEAVAVTAVLHLFRA